MTDQDPDPDPDDMDVDCSMDVDCGAADMSDYNDDDIEAMDDGKREQVRRQVPLSQDSWRVRFDETANSYHDVVPYSNVYNQFRLSRRLAYTDHWEYIAERADVFTGKPNSTLRR